MCRNGLFIHEDLRSDAVRVLIKFVALYIISMGVFVGIIAMGVYVFKTRNRQ